jgi:FMN phosphatase YigB (HAD superfamily)
MRIEPSQALYVGNDPDADVAGLQAIGMPVILIDRGDSLHHAQVPRIRDLREIPELIRKNYPA